MFFYLYLMFVYSINPNAKKWFTWKSNDTRTIRISGKTFDKINELAEKNELSFNSVINQIIEYGLENLEE